MAKSTGGKKGDKPPPRGLNVPKPGAKMRGKSVEQTTTQRKAAEVILAKMRTANKNKESFSLRTNCSLGHHADLLLSDAKRNEFGKMSADDIALDLGVKGTSVKLYRKFYLRMKAKGGQKIIAELAGLKRSPSWHQMVKWLGVKDAIKSNRIWDDMMSGKAFENVRFEMYLRSVLGAGPTRKKRPADPDIMFKKLTDSTDSFTAEIKEWIPKAKGDIDKIKELARKRQVQSSARETLVKFKLLLAALPKAIESCEQLVKLVK